MNRKQKIIVSIVGITIVLLALLGITYAYYLTRIEGNTNTNSISVSTANLKLVYSDGNEELDFTNIMPGWINDGLNNNPEPKTFSVTNRGNASVNEYAVSLEEVTNTLTRTEDLTYTLKCTQKDSSGNIVGTCNGNNGEYPKVNQMIITNSIESSYTHEYELVVNYINHETINQSIDMGSTIKGKVQIYGLADTIDITGTVSDYNDGDYIEINSEPKTSKIVNNIYTLIGIKPGVHTLKVCSKSDIDCANPKVIKKILIEKGTEVLITEKEVNDETIPSIIVTEDTRTINVNVDVINTSITPSTTTSTYNPFEYNTLAYNIYKNKALVEEYDASGNSLGTKTNKNVKSLPVVTGVSDGTNIEDSGLFMAQDDYGTSYFYRGTIRNNYVDFAGFTWRIVRINGDGSIRLILDESTNQVVINDEEVYNNSNLKKIDADGLVPYKASQYNDNAYVGYMYGIAGSDNYDSTHKNDNDSLVKKYIDSFYEEYLINYQDDYLSDTIFCGDKSLASKDFLDNNTALGYGMNVTYYAATERIYMDKGKTFIKVAKPTLECAKGENNTYSRYTSKIYIDEKTSKGISLNNDLKYPIALLSADELVMAGAWNLVMNQNYYLYYNIKNNIPNSYVYWWTMTPYYFNGEHGRIFDTYITGSSIYSGTVYNELAIRPVINIKSNVLVNSGNGTQTNPYVLE